MYRTQLLRVFEGDETEGLGTAGASMDRGSTCRN